MYCFGILKEFGYFIRAVSIPSEDFLFGLFVVGQIPSKDCLFGWSESQERMSLGMYF